VLGGKLTLQFCLLLCSWPEWPGRFRCRTRGDWGLVGDADWKENDLSVHKGFRILSVYETQARRRFWIITEADRSSTCILLPDEY